MFNLSVIFFLILTIFPALIIPTYWIIRELIQKNYKILLAPFALSLALYFVNQSKIEGIISLITYLVVFIPFSIVYVSWLLSEFFQSRYKSFFFGFLPILIPMASLFFFNFFWGDLILITQAQHNMKMTFDSPAYECCEKLINEYPNSPYLIEAIEMRNNIFKRNPELRYLKKQKN